MKNLLLLVMGASILTAVAALAADKSIALERFYGKIATLTPESKVIVVHNKTRNQDLRVNWDDKTVVTGKKVLIQPAQLTVGEFVAVSYVAEGESNIAKNIDVRALPTHPKKTAN